MWHELQPRRECRVPLALFVIWAAIYPGMAMAGLVPCSSETPFQAIRDGFISHEGRAAGVAATSILPSDGDAQIVFHEALGGASGPRLFRVFEARGATPDSFKGAELPILSVQQAPDKLVLGYNASDSVLLDVLIPAHTLSAWQRRSFVVLACADGQVVGWSLITARVSSPLVSNLVCFAVALLVYLLAMGAVWMSRRSRHALEAKYPAIFGARRLSWADFLNPVHLTANAFNRASVQKLQVLLFSFLVGWLVLFRVLQSGTLVDLSPTVVGLLGISGIGAATAQITYQQKTRLSFENWAWLERRGVLEKPAAQELRGPQWRDLVLTNREFDVYKLQTIIFSVTVAFAMGFAGGADLASFSVPATLLGILGLSQVVYVGGILVKPPAVDDLD